MKIQLFIILILMEIEDIRSIITEITNLRGQGILLSDFLNGDRILHEFDEITLQMKHGRYVLPKKNPKSRECFFV